MSTVETTPPADVDHVAAAIAALTAAARQTRTVGAGTPAEHTEPIDFAELACHVLTAVAANVGGVEVLLAGRPGSWEADLIHQVVTNTAGLDDIRYRTEPVKVYVDVEWAFEKGGLEAAYEERAAAAAEGVNEAVTALYEAEVTDTERENHDALWGQLSVDEIGRLAEWTPETTQVMEQSTRLRAAVVERARANHPDLAAQEIAAEEALAAVEAHYEAQKASYTDAFLTSARTYLASIGLDHLGVELADHPVIHDQVADDATEYAKTHTPLPQG